MTLFLLGAILALLWVPTAQAEVLLQPDFNAEKVPGASAVLRWVGAEPPPETT